MFGTDLGHVWSFLLKPSRPETDLNRLWIWGSSIQKRLSIVWICWGKYAKFTQKWIFSCDLLMFAYVMLMFFFRCVMMMKWSVLWLNLLSLHKSSVSLTWTAHGNLSLHIGSPKRHPSWSLGTNRPSKLTLTLWTRRHLIAPLRS